MPPRPPFPYSVLTDVQQAPGWWPSNPCDPRRGLAWAEGSRWPGDEVAFLGTDGGPALWIRPAGGGRSSPRQDAAEVCSGVAAGLPPDPELFTRARTAGQRQLVAGANGYVSPLVASRDVSWHEVAGLVAAMRETAQRDRAVPAFLHCAPGDPLLGPLREAGFVIGVTDLYATIHLPGDRFDDYLALLPSHARRNVRRERRMLAPARARVHVGAESEPRLSEAAELVASAYADRGQHRNVADVRDSYRTLLRAFGDDFILCTVEADEGTVASCCLLAGGTDLLAFSVGMRQPAARTHAGYFHAAYYIPIEIAYARGLQRLLLGPATVQAKALRGARFTPMLAAVPGACEPMAAALRATDAALRNRYGRITAMPADPDQAAPAGSWAP